MEKQNAEESEKRRCGEDCSGASTLLIPDLTDNADLSSSEPSAALLPSQASSGSLKEAGESTLTVFQGKWVLGSIIWDPRVDRGWHCINLVVLSPNTQPNGFCCLFINGHFATDELPAINSFYTLLSNLGPLCRGLHGNYSAVLPCPGERTFLICLP